MVQHEFTWFKHLAYKKYAVICNLSLKICLTDHKSLLNISVKFDYVKSYRTKIINFLIGFY